MGFGDLDEPASGAAADIEYTLKCRRIGLLGQHTTEVLRSLGYDDATIARLQGGQAAGVTA